MFKGISEHLIAKTLKLGLYDLTRDNFMGWLSKKVTSWSRTLLGHEHSMIFAGNFKSSLRL